MNPLKIHVSSFKELAPLLLEQVMLGSEEKRAYSFPTGHIYVQLSCGKDSNTLAHTLRSSGSMDMCTIAGKVQDLLNMEDLKKFYKLENEVAREGVSSAFRQILSGEERKVYQLLPLTELAVELKKTPDGYFSARASCKEAHTEDGRQVEEFVRKLFALPSIFKYFDFSED